jgi:ATP-dependent helicase HrpA
MSEDNPYHGLSMYKGAPLESFLKAKNFRENMTEAEKILWEKLKDNRFEDYKFRRQHPINIYIVDFYCHKLKLVIEVDGEYHTMEQQKLKDTERTEILVFQDLKIIRFTNEEVLNNIESVLEVLKQQIIPNSTSKGEI